MTKEFRFVQEVDLNEEQYVAIWRSGKYRKRWRVFFYQLILAVIIGGVSFLSVYTIALGIAIACFFIWLGLMYFLPPPLLKRGYRSHRSFHDPITFIVSNEGISVKGKYIQASVHWKLFSTWQILGEWLVLTSEGIPQAYFKVEELKQSNVFDSIMALATKHGKEFT